MKIDHILCLTRKGILSIILILQTKSIAAYGDIQDSLPSSKEREVLVFTNAVRMAPVAFRDKYILSTSILLPANYPAVGPVWYNHDLSRSSHFHSLEMANTCGMVHNSCDGSSFDKRVYSYYKASSYIGENIASGNATGIATVIQWLRDDNASKVPASDKSTDGHRENIMNAQYQELGCGYAYSSTREWYHFWTQDFGGGTGAGYKIPAGCHFFAPGNTTNLSFAANYYDKSGSAPLKASIFIDNIEFPMSLILGTASAGTYLYTINDHNAHCYYFQFTDGTGALIRYPATAKLSTGSGPTCPDNHIRKNSLSRTDLNSNHITFSKSHLYSLNGSRFFTPVGNSIKTVNSASGLVLCETPDQFSGNQLTKVFIYK